MHTLLIDNYDSYTYNLYQLLAVINKKEPKVIRNNEMNWLDLQQFLQKNLIDNIVISPGPGHPSRPDDFGICGSVILESHKPVLGICLGHQGIASLFGAQIVPTPETIHGRVSQIRHTGIGLFRGIPQQISVVRYHSLMVARNHFPACLRQTAWTTTGLLMALQHQNRPLYGVQFHPESICTEYGKKLLQNFQHLTKQFYTSSSAFSIPNKTKITLVNEKSLTQNRLVSRRILPNKLHVFTKKLSCYSDAEQVFYHLFRKEKQSFWLDSSRVEQGLARFSFMGAVNDENGFWISYSTNKQKLQIHQNGKIREITKSIFDFLTEELDAHFCLQKNESKLPFTFNGGFVGYFGYELKAECGGQQTHQSPFPDAVFLFANQIIVFDHQEKRTYLVWIGQKQQYEKAGKWFQQTESELKQLSPLPILVLEKQKNQVYFHFNRDKTAYLQDIKQCLQYIKAGESYEVCLTNQLYTTHTFDPFYFYRLLRKKNPAPYAAFFRFGDTAIACSSPECFLGISSDRKISSKPIKGTIIRDIDEEKDKLLYKTLKNSEKDKAENLMIVDLLRNDLGRVCEIGSVEVPKLMDVESYANVHQMVSTVSGQLRKEVNAVSAVHAAFPGGSMTGAPKIRTMQLIDKLEGKARGIYSGALGFLALNGAAEFNIIIRTAVITPNGMSIGVGGAITALSNSEEEWEELHWKAKALIETAKCCK